MDPPTMTALCEQRTSAAAAAVNARELAGKYTAAAETAEATVAVLDVMILANGGAPLPPAPDPYALDPEAEPVVNPDGPGNA